MPYDMAMKMANIAEFKNHLSEYLAAVADGGRGGDSKTERAACTGHPASGALPQPDGPGLRRGHGGREVGPDRTHDPPGRLGDVAGRSVVKLVLDTCAILWSVSDPARLPDPVAEALVLGDTEVCVSAISCAEIACASERGRLELDRHWRLWFRHYVERNAWTVFPIDLEVVEEAYALPEPFPRDPADRLIVATARRLRAPVVTADARMLGYPHVKTLWAT